MLENHFGVSISNAPPLHSVSNGQVERFHSTLVELSRCLKIDKGISDTVELILLATARYNKSIHSVIDKRPADVIQTQSDHAPTTSRSSAPTPEIKVYSALEIRDTVQCSEPLDAVKCLPEFAGAQESYVSWRQAATAAYHIFRRYNGSSRHYQAVIIKRSKIRGPADAVLSPFGTILNFGFHLQ